MRYTVRICTARGETLETTTHATSSAKAISRVLGWKRMEDCAVTSVQAWPVVEPGSRWRRRGTKAVPVIVRDVFARLDVPVVTFERATTLTESGVIMDAQTAVGWDEFWEPA